MNNTMRIVNSATLQEAGTKALIKELGVTGMLRYLEQYDNGGSGDYTKEKYEKETLSMEEFLNISPDFVMGDTQKTREYHHYATKNMMVCEQKEYYNAKGRAFQKEIEEEKKKNIQQFKEED